MTINGHGGRRAGRAATAALLVAATNQPRCTDQLRCANQRTRKPEAQMVRRVATTLTALATMSVQRLRSGAITLGALMTLMLAAFGAASAWAETTTTICVPEAAEKPVLSSKAGKCTKPKYTMVALPGAGGLATLNKVLPHINYVESGVGSRPTLQFTGVNVQVVDGEGKTATTNGVGNLVIGYDEGGRTQTGSHSLILGSEQEFTSYGAIVGGYKNSVKGPYASVTGGYGSFAYGELSSISGGLFNTTIQNEDSVSGGVYNTAGGATGEKFSWVGGGYKNTADLEGSSIFGGYEVKVKNKFEGCGGSPTKLNC